MSEQLAPVLLIPVKKCQFTPGRFAFSKKPVLASPKAWDVVGLEQVQHDLSLLGRKASIVANAFGSADIRIIHSAQTKVPQSYGLDITSTGITITAGDDAGAYYGLQTLRDIIKNEGASLRCLKILDWPDFGRRGVYHDCSRGKVPTLETLKQLVVRLAHWKINELSLYIEDVFTFTRHPDIGKGSSPLAPQEICELRDFCKIHHVRLVGSLASLGHMEHILKLPRYQKLGELPGYRYYPGGTMLCPTDPGSIKLVGELYEEIIPLFDAPDFNVCGDEPWELGKGRSQALASRVGTGKVYVDFILKLHKLCQKYGKRMNMWADIVLSHPETLKMLPRDIVMLNWEYEASGKRTAQTAQIAKAGFEFMVCPGTSSWNAHGTRLANSMENVCEFAEIGLKYKSAGMLNTDWGDNGHRNFLGVSMHGFAHGAAHSWNHSGVDDQKFTKNFCRDMFGCCAKGIDRLIVAIGSTYKLCGAPHFNESALFWGLIEPLVFKNAGDPYKPDSPRNRSRIDSMTDKGLAAVIKQLAPSQDIAVHFDHLDDFDAMTVIEYQAAASMDLLAAKRALVAKAMRKGESISSNVFKEIAAEMHSLSSSFSQIWMARNRRSRLNDNLKIFRQVEREALKYSHSR